MNWRKSADEALDYLGYFEQNLPYRDAIDLMLVFLGRRPACLVMDPEDEKLEKIRYFCEEYNLHMMVKENKRDSDPSRTAVFIFKEKGRFELIKNSEGRFYGFSERKVGKFLGFTDEDVEYFADNIEKGPIEAKTREKAAELAEEGLIDRE